MVYFDRMEKEHVPESRMRMLPEGAIRLSDVKKAAYDELILNSSERSAQIQSTKIARYLFYRARSLDPNAISQTYDIQYLEKWQAESIRDEEPEGGTVRYSPFRTKEQFMLAKKIMSKLLEQ